MARKKVKDGHQQHRHQHSRSKQKKQPVKSGIEDDPLQYLHLLQPGIAGYLQADPGEKTWKIPQARLVEEVPLQASKKRFSLRLEKGPYQLDYSRNGRSLLLAGRRGHVAAFEWESGKLRCELTLDETVRAATWLQGESFFAVAQRRYTYIYDAQGTEVHRLEAHQEVQHLEYLPYHFLLVSLGATGVLRYQDITDGRIIAEPRTTLGRCTTMCQNPSNGVVHVGHAGGLMSLWSPAVGGGPLVTMQCHSSPITAIAIDPRDGKYMATAGCDGRVAVWDLRTFRRLHEYTPLRPATSLDISQRGLLAAAYGPHVTVWGEEGLARRIRNPYMHHLQGGSIVSCVRFCPYDDVLGAGHDEGVESLLIPGAGEPNFDSFEANPLAGRAQRREAEVKQLLDKLPPETIHLDPNALLGSVVRTEEERHRWKLETELRATHPDGAAATLPPRNPNKGPGKAKRERLKRRENIIDTNNEGDELVFTTKREADPPTPLDRFKLKSL